MILLCVAFVVCVHPRIHHCNKDQDDNTFQGKATRVVVGTQQHAADEKSSRVAGRLSGTSVSIP